jgi:hypothetical protein
MWVGLQTSSTKRLVVATGQAPTLSGPWLLANGSTPMLSQNMISWCSQLPALNPKPKGSVDGACSQLLPACRLAVSSAAAGAAASSSLAPGLNNYLCTNTLPFICQQEGGCAAPCGQAIQPGTALNIMNADRSTVRTKDNRAYAVVLPGTGNQLAEQFMAFVPGSLSSTSSIYPGGDLVLKSLQTGLYCRLATATVGVLRSPARGTTPKGTAPDRCATKGLVCDQPSFEAAFPFTYTGTGLQYQGVPLVQAPVTGVMLLTSDAACATAAGAAFTFPVAPAAAPAREPAAAAAAAAAAGLHH